MAAYDRVDRIARAARSAGDPRTLAQLRADVFTAVLAGNPFHTVPPTDPLTRQADAEYPARPDPDENSDGPVSRSGNGNPAEPDEWEPIGVATFGDAEPPDLDSRFETGNGAGSGEASGGRPVAQSRSENGKAHPAAGGGGRRVRIPFRNRESRSRRRPGRRRATGARAAGSSPSSAAAWSTSRSS